MSVLAVAAVNAKTGLRAAVPGRMGMDVDRRSVDCCHSR